MQVMTKLSNIYIYLKKNKIGKQLGIGQKSPKYPQKEIFKY